MAGLLTTKNEPNERRTKKSDSSIFDNINSSSNLHSLTIFDLAVLIFSVLSIFVDLFTDLILVTQYSYQGYSTWAISTFVLIFFPSIIVQFFSLRWHVVHHTASVLQWVLHFFMLGLVHRYVQTIEVAFTAFKSKNSSDIQKVLFEESDLCILHLFESFLESAPQLVLQIYIIVILQEWKFWTGLSTLASLLSLSWALAAYTKAQRRARAHKNSTTWPALLFQAVWRIGMLTSRISSLVLGAYCFGKYIILIIIIHWIAMTVWITYQNTDFCETYWEEKIYNAVVGVIYCFCFFNLREGQSRYRALGYYLIIIFQNLTCLTIFLMWFGEKTPKLAISGFIAIVGGTMIGSTGLLFYYRFFHPSGPIKILFSTQSAPTESNSSFYSSLSLRSLKRIRCETQSNQKTTPLSDPKIDLTTSFTDSIVVIEENVSDNSDIDIKKLQNWINEVSDKDKISLDINKDEVNETEADAYKRRAICSSVDLVKLLDFKTKPECESLKLGTDEAYSEILSAHDYENLCAVNIARETWGLRSWQGYSDIETWLHDDSIIHDRHLDTLTSTTSSDFSANTFQKENETTRQEDYIDAIAEDLAQCETETSSDYALAQYAVDSYPTLGPLDPIFEEIEDSSTNSPELPELKKTNDSASTLVATIDKIRLNTPIRRRHQAILEGIYDPFSSVQIKPIFQRNWKKVTFAPKLLAFPEDQTEPPINNNEFELITKQNEDVALASKQLNKTDDLAEHNVTSKSKENATNIFVQKNFISETKGNPRVEIWNKENIPTLAFKINHWSKILNPQNEKITSENLKSCH